MDEQRKVATTTGGAIACAGYLAGGTVETPAFARAAWAFELYVFGHLGTAFVVAAAIATKEHQCPIGPLRPIDQWEARRRD